MAATVSSVWAKPGAWALDSEENEEELSKPIPKPEVPAADFPSLAAAATAPKPKKKNKGQTLSLAEFTTYKPKRVTQDEPISLPTGPRERTAEELEQTRGFRNYGGGDRDSSRARVSRDSDRERDMGSSRADEADDWSKSKKFSSFGGSGTGSGFGSEREMGSSRADEVDDWSKGKKFGGGFGGERREKVGFFNSSRADDVDNWAANKSFSGPQSEGRRERRMGFDSYSSGPGSDGDNWLKNKDVNVGNGGGSGRPRLNLQRRTLPVNGNGNGVSPGEGKVKGANPFGEARPREEVLKEKGKDWKEIDEKLEAVKIVNKEETNGDVFGRRRGFGMGRSEGGGDERSVRSWRKPEANDAPPTSSAEATENSAEITESTEKAEEEN